MLYFPPDSRGECLTEICGFSPDLFNCAVAGGCTLQTNSATSNTYTCGSQITPLCAPAAYCSACNGHSLLNQVLSAVNAVLSAVRGRPPLGKDFSMQQCAVFTPQSMLAVTHFPVWFWYCLCLCCSAGSLNQRCRPRYQPFAPAAVALCAYLAEPDTHGHIAVFGSAANSTAPGLAATGAPRRSETEILCMGRRSCSTVFAIAGNGTAPGTTTAVGRRRQLLQTNYEKFLKVFVACGPSHCPHI